MAAGAIRRGAPSKRPSANSKAATASRSRRDWPRCPHSSRHYPSDRRSSIPRTVTTARVVCSNDSKRRAGSAPAPSTSSRRPTCSKRWTGPTCSGWSPRPTRYSASRTCRRYCARLATRASWPSSTTRSPRPCCNSRSPSAPVRSCTQRPSTSAVTPIS